MYSVDPKPTCSYHCVACGRRYVVQSYVRLLEMTEEQAEFAKDYVEFKVGVIDDE